jgi:ATP-binding cassette, subfamily C (CFTR/MRP), member 1
MAQPDEEKAWIASYEKGNSDREAQEPVELEPLTTIETFKEHGLRPEESGDLTNGLETLRSKSRSDILSRSQSRATEAGEYSDKEDEDVKKKWYRRLNPLRWGPMPPVPKERQVSRETNAGFWSKLTFQWMAPLMRVSLGHWMQG